MGRPPKDGERGGTARRSPKWSAASTYMHGGSYCPGLE